MIAFNNAKVQKFSVISWDRLRVYLRVYSFAQYLRVLWLYLWASSQYLKKCSPAMFSTNFDLFQSLEFGHFLKMNFKSWQLQELAKKTRYTGQPFLFSTVSFRHRDIRTDMEHTDGHLLMNQIVFIHKKILFMGNMNWKLF